MNDQQRAELQERLIKEAANQIRFQATVTIAAGTVANRTVSFANVAHDAILLVDQLSKELNK